MSNSAFTKPTIATPISLANGGTGAALTDPNADRIVFWDDSAGSVAFLTAGSGLSITGTTMTATATGSGDVVGPASATDNALVRFDSTTGKLVQNSTAILLDDGSLGLGTSPSNPLHLVKSNLSSGSAALFDITQTTVNTSDLADSAFNLKYGLTASSASSELIARAFKLDFTNTLTGGGAITNARILNLATNTAASTTTTNLDVIHIETGTTSGTVTTGTGLHIATLQGTTKWGIKDDSGGNWTLTGQIQASPGNAASPGYAFSSGTGEGMYRTASTLLFAVGGTERFKIGTSNITVSTAGGGLILTGASSGTTTLAAASTASGTLTLPAATDTLVARDTTDTLTNKTLTAPVIATIVNTGTLTVPTSTDTLVGRATTDTLTNKTISGSSNTITNVSLSTGITGTLPVANGGTGQTTYTDGQLLIGNSTGNTLTKSTITAGAGVTVTNGNGSITIASPGYTLQAAAAQFTPTSGGSSHFWGSTFAQSPGGAGNERIYIPKAGTIKSVYLFVVNTGTAGTTETSTMSIRLNNTTDTTITSSFITSTTPNSFSNTGLSIAVATGDYIEIKWVTPTWATPPTNIRLAAVIYIE